MATMSATYMRDYRAKRAASGGGGLLPFQQAFTDAVCRVNNPPEIAAASWPRASGKSWLCGGLVARSLTPGDPLFEPQVENILVSSSTATRRGSFWTSLMLRWGSPTPTAGKPMVRYSSGEPGAGTDRF